MVDGVAGGIERVVRAEPLTSEGFAPFGQVVGQDEVTIELRGEEIFHLDVISYDHKPLRFTVLNRHHNATQALVALNGKPTVVLVGPADLDFSTVDHLDALRAFVCDGSAGINLALGTWHAGPYPLTDHVDLVNVQGKHVLEDDVEEAHLERDLGVVVTISL
jgi:ureidoglycolate lyase